MFAFLIAFLNACSSGIFPKARIKLLLFDKCPTRTSSISSAPVRYHFGISGAHICQNFLSEKPSWFARILELKASSQEPLDVDRWQASCCYFLHSLGGDELALGVILQLSSTMDKHKVTRFSYTVAFT